MENGKSGLARRRLVPQFCPNGSFISRLFLIKEEGNGGDAMPGISCSSVLGPRMPDLSHDTTT